MADRRAGSVAGGRSRPHPPATTSTAAPSTRSWARSSRARSARSRGYGTADTRMPMSAATPGTPAVLPGVGRDAAQRPLLEEVALVVEDGDVGQVDAGDRPGCRPGRGPRGPAARGCPTGAKRMAASSGSGGAVVGPPGAGRPQVEGQAAGVGGPRVITWTRAPLGQGDLGRQVGRTAEPVDPEAAAGRQLGPPQGPVADDPGAQQRRRLDVAEAVGQPVGEPLVDHRELGVAAVDVPPGERRRPCTGSPGPARQNRQAPQVRASQGMPTRSPSASGAHPGPSAVDRPDHLVAGHHPGVPWARSPSARWRSVRHTPHTETRTAHLPGPRLGHRSLHRLERPTVDRSGTARPAPGRARPRPAAEGHDHLPTERRPRRQPVIGLHRLLERDGGDRRPEQPRAARSSTSTSSGRCPSRWSGSTPRRAGRRS